MYLKLKIFTTSKTEKVEKIKLDEWKIWVKQEAEMNLANARIIEIMREQFPNKKIRIISGHHSPSKIVAID